MTDWKKVRDEAADELGDAYSFQAGYDYAMANDPRVKALVEALELLDKDAAHYLEYILKSKEPTEAYSLGRHDTWKWVQEKAREALKAFEGSGT